MSDLISRLSELRCQYNCFDENERDVYHTLSEAIKALSDDPDTNAGDTISRQAAIDAIKEDKIDLTNPTIVAFFKATGDFEKAETQVMTCDRHIKILKDLPSVDAVEVVRCKDCKWFNDIGCSIRIVDDSDKPTENDYCSFAERRLDG